ncbi:hypothetical protein HYG86_15725 [Alkalicella caledoniensis]|uniref:DUF7305 domain-containing protein n=1 Tax=Alkalicella caledoniensis TaxID=2731377 RepID=A0A7G9WBQ1_ALKCA|nr:hypothetical protein [Alkalicella caledoniensis]QNO16113.1 hypothetical protein HYG86_15725 [Alkalicella caledoniensis]
MLKFLDNKGSSLTLVLIVLMIMAVLGSTALFAMSSEGKQAARHDHKVQAYYLARTGAEAVSEYIIQNPNNISDIDMLISSIPSDMTNPLGNNGSIAIEAVRDDNKVIITSTGIFKGVEDVVVLELTLPGFSLLDYAIFTLSYQPDKMDLKNNISIVGPIGSNSTIATKNKTDAPDITENANIPMSELPQFDASLFPAITSLQNNYNTSSGDLYVRVHGEKTNRTITVEGNNILHLLVQGELELHGNGEIKTEGNSKIIIYVMDGSEVTISGGSRINAFVYAPYSVVTWNGGGSATEPMLGGFIAQEFNGPSSNGQVIEHDVNLLLQGAFTNIDELVTGTGSSSFERHWSK